MPLPTSIKPLVCLRCLRDPDDIRTNPPASGADPESHSPATVTCEQEGEEVVFYLVLHKPGCGMVHRAQGGAK